ncbi:hypothetical protein GLUCOINTEAF2_0201001 [Komagataeibacter intermedius AF2]|uniref:Uncharacterized protein n=1 Tax=Komagataeibacter intermedius AF2 TaxID=1458464 RepID=A0A0N0MDW0_9PROT|nr:hypothetical protein GLUCOINTEAF2_0201001 [Komagataeibacter intermedius AF2]
MVSPNFSSRAFRVNPFHNRIPARGATTGGTGACRRHFILMQINAPPYIILYTR